MYSWLLRPDTIPRSYSIWVSTAAKVLQPTVLVNRGFARTGRPDPKDMKELIDWKVRVNWTDIGQLDFFPATVPDSSDRIQLRIIAL